MRKRKTPQPTTLFATAAELDVPPVDPRDGDLSRIRVIDRDSPAGQEELRKRAMRKAGQDALDRAAALIEGMGVL